MQLNGLVLQIFVVLGTMCTLLAIASSSWERVQGSVRRGVEMVL